MSKIAVVQFKASLDKNKNLPRIINYIEEASKKNTDLIAFPEYMIFYTPKSQSPS